MLKKTTNSTVAYEPIAISDETVMKFQKVTNAKGVTVYGKILKNDAECGSVSYDGAGDYLITSLKPCTLFTPDEVTAIHSEVPKCIGEILAD